MAPESLDWRIRKGSTWIFLVGDSLGILPWQFTIFHHNLGEGFLVHFVLLHLKVIKSKLTMIFFSPPFFGTVGGILRVSAYMNMIQNTGRLTN